MRVGFAPLVFHYEVYESINDVCALAHLLNVNCVCEKLYSLHLSINKLSMISISL